MTMRQDISARDCLLSNLRAGVLTGALAGVVQFLVFKLMGVYSMESFSVHIRSLLQIVGMTSLLFAGAGLLLGLIGSLVLSRIRSVWARALTGPQPAPMWVFGLLAIPTMWFLAWFNFSFRRARDPWCIVFNVGFLLIILVGAILLQHSRYRSASAGPRSRSQRPSLAVAALLLLAAGCVFALGRSSLIGLLDEEVEPQKLRGPLPEILREQARAAFPDSSFNIILLTVDALRPDHLGCYGYPRQTSPTIDSLAASGAIFNNAVVQYPMTSPNFATMFTGTYPTTHGIIRVRTVLGDDNLTLAEVLQAAGYHTSAAITNGNLYPVFNYSQGFDEYHRCGHKEPERVTRTALEWLAGRPPEPFFVWMHYTEPHGPYNPRAPFDTMFDPADNPKTATMGSEAHEARVASAIARYDGSIRRTDHAIRRLLEGFREMGYGENSLLVFTTDHGESFGEHGYYFGHGAYAYEATVRAALLMTFPGVIPSGIRVDAPVGTVDIMPTVLDAVGLPIGDRIEGHSFLPTAIGLTDQTPGEFAFVQAGVVKHGALGFVSAIRSEQYKYIRRHREWGHFPKDPASWLLSLTSVFEGGLSTDELYAIKDAREVDNLIRKDPAMARLLRTKVDRFISYLHQVEDRHEPQRIDPSDLDAETYEALKSLGYIK